MEERPSTRRNDTSHNSPLEDSDATRNDLGEEETRTIPLREEELVAHKERRAVGEVRVHKVVEEFPGRLEVDATREEVEVLHVPVGRAVEERRAPWQDGDTFVMPIYEEQMVLVKRLVLKEEVRVRRLVTSERQVHEDRLRRDRPVVEDTTERGVVRERFSTDADDQFGEKVAETPANADEGKREGPLDRLARRILD